MGEAAAIVGGVQGAAGIIGGIAQAGATSAAGAAAQRGYEAQLAEARRTQEMAIKAAEPSEMEIKSLEQAYTGAQYNLDRQKKLLDSADPALLEVGKQALDMLQGKKDVGSLSVINRQRGMQRDQLLERLKQQLGPGAETSSIGQQSLQRFDQDTADMLQLRQEQTLGQFLGIAQNISGQGLGSQVQGLQNIATSRGNINQRQVNAITGTAGNIIENAGAGEVAGLYNARAAGQLAGTLATPLAQLGGAAFSSMGDFLKSGSSSNVAGDTVTKLGSKMLPFV